MEENEEGEEVKTGKRREEEEEGQKRGGERRREGRRDSLCGERRGDASEGVSVPWLELSDLASAGPSF